MKSRSQKQGSALIVYDADRLQHPDAQLFDDAYWRGQGGLAGEAVGRGSALFLDTPFGDAVLRHYLRGGLPGKFIHDRYLFTGWVRSRPVSEFHVLARLSGAGLPVPQPLAAITRRSGPTYTGSLLTRRIMGALPLADVLVGHEDKPEFWMSVGACIRRFHEQGVVHADLNARNILLGPGDGIYLIDFDRARISGGGERAFARNLARLRRSFDKLWPQAIRPRLDPCWQRLIEGYGKGEAQSGPS